MPRHSHVKIHPQRGLIEAMLAADVPLHVIAASFGVSVFSASRHRVFMRTKDRFYWRALRVATATRGSDRRTKTITNSVPENHNA